jgi:hypothetical protein
VTRAEVQAVRHERDHSGDRRVADGLEHDLVPAALHLGQGVDGARPLPARGEMRHGGDASVERRLGDDGRR